MAVLLTQPQVLSFARLLYQYVVTDTVLLPILLYQNK